MIPEEFWPRLEEAYDKPRDALERMIEMYNAAMAFPNYTYYDRNGEVIEVGEAMLLAALDEYRQVDETMVANLRVSTVWLGWSYTSHLFETAVFPDGNSLPLEVKRYNTEAEAQAGHRLMVENCTKARRP